MKYASYWIIGCDTLSTKAAVVWQQLFTKMWAADGASEEFFFIIFPDTQSESFLLTSWECSQRSYLN